MGESSFKAEVVNLLRQVKRRSKAAVSLGAERVVLRGILQHAIGYPAASSASAGPGGRQKPHFLIARYKYHAHDPSLGPSTEEQALDNTLEASGFGTSDTYFWETEYSGFPRGDWALLDKCRRVRPDAIVLSSYEPGYAAHPRLDTIRMIRKTWGIPIVAIWYDTCWDGFWASIEPALPYIDVHVISDNPLMTFLEGRDPSIRRRFVDQNHPWDFSVYNDPGRPRDIEVSFLGQVGGYRSARMPYIAYLMEHNVPVYWSGFNRAEQPPLSKYVEVLTRSKIGLNFSHSVNHHQMKGRIFEVMLCGAMLMESENPQTPCYLRPMKDYVSFESPPDLVEKLRYFLDHDDERTAIAARGHERALQHCDNYAFWKKIADRIEEAREWPL